MQEIGLALLTMAAALVSMAKVAKAGKTEPKEKRWTLQGAVREWVSRQKGSFDQAKVVEAMLPLYTKEKGEPPKRFSGMVWWAIQRCTVRGERGSYKKAKEGSKTQFDLIKAETPQRLKAKGKKAKKPKGKKDKRPKVSAPSKRRKSAVSESPDERQAEVVKAGAPEL